MSERGNTFTTVRSEGGLLPPDLLARIVVDPDSLDESVQAVMSPPLPMIGSGEPIDMASDRLAESAAVLVVDSGHPTGIVTRSDLLDFLSGPPPR